jgi:ligand-binding SRPBCC domain-containing protein
MDDVGYTVFESCHSTWVFDTERRRFRRILKGLEVEHHPVGTQWRSYHHLDCTDDSEAFTVVLNAAGTRLIRSWRHTTDCTQCSGHVTSQLSRDEIEAMVVA